MGRRNNKKVFEIEVTDDEESDEEYCQYQIESIEDEKKEEIHTELNLNGKNMTLKVDTGARINVISLNELSKIEKKSKITAHNKIKIKAYGGDTFKTMGTVDIKCSHNYCEYIIKFHVVDRQVTTLLGLQDTLRLQLIKLSTDVHQIIEENSSAPELEQFKELFNDDIGKLPVQYKMKIDSKATAVVKPPRKVPVAMKAAVEEELNRMEKLGIIEKVEEPTE